jgi:signal peptide peptidase SppA
MPSRSHILSAFMETPWAILPQKLIVLEEIVIRHISGEKLTAEEVQTRIHGAIRPPERTVSNSVAILPLFGTIFPRANMMTDVSGATSAERFGQTFDTLVADPNISAIVLDVNSPGGQAGGIQELSTKIYQARSVKPIVAVANFDMASAAYWIGTSASELVVSPSGQVGSIGVFSVHEDISKALEQDGVKVTLIKQGKFKAEANPYEPLSEEARAAIEMKVSEVYDAFISAIARNRDVKPSIVRNGFGEGRMVNAEQAVELGMADRVGTLDETISRLLGVGALPSSMQANQSVNLPLASDSSDPAAAEKERQAQSLRDRVNQILNKEIPNA